MYIYLNFKIEILIKKYLCEFEFFICILIFLFN